MTRLYLQNLFEYLYDFIAKKGKQVLFDRLERQEYIRVMDHNKLIRYLENISLDEKLILCSKLGLRTALVLWDEAKQGKKKVRDVLITDIEVPEHELHRHIIVENIFAAMDIDFIRAIQLVSKASNSPMWTVNRKYLAIRENSKTIRPRMLSQKLEAENNLDWYVQTISFALGIEPILEGHGISLDQFRVLLFLHGCPNGAVKPAFGKVVSTANITQMLNKMIRMNLVRDAIGKEVYSISTYGLIVLEKIVARFP